MLGSCAMCITHKAREVAAAAPHCIRWQGLKRTSSQPHRRLRRRRQLITSRRAPLSVRLASFGQYLDDTSFGCIFFLHFSLKLFHGDFTVYCSWNLNL